MLTCEFPVGFAEFPPHLAVAKLFWGKGSEEHRFIWVLRLKLCALSLSRNWLSVEVAHSCERIQNTSLMQIHGVQERT